MPRPTCLEDGYEYRVKRIFRHLREAYKDSETETPFEDWVWQNKPGVADVFLTDVVEYMGLPEEGE